MNNFKKVIAFLCSATLIAGSSITAFAAAPSSTAGDGNIIAYGCETVTVPTAISVSFNPQGWDFVTRHTATPVKSTKQIVSLNYGISSMATLDKKINIEFAIEGTEGTGTEKIEFVDAEEKAQAKTESNTDGAAPGEYKMYLAVAPASAAVTKGYETAFADEAYTVTEVTYAIAAGDDGVKAHNITAKSLADVDMTAATAGIQAFEDNKATIAYQLGAAEYELQTNKNPDFTTTQAQMAELVQPKTLGDITGFTFVGAMNPQVDWTKVNVTALKITPTYEIVDIDGTEEAIASAGYGQIEPFAEASALSAKTISKTNGGSITVTGKTVSAIVMTKNDNTTVNAVAGQHYTKTGSSYAFTASILNNKTKLTFKFDDNSSEDVTVE